MSSPFDAMLVICVGMLFCIFKLEKGREKIEISVRTFFCWRVNLPSEDEAKNGRGKRRREIEWKNFHG